MPTTLTIIATITSFSLILLFSWFFGRKYQQKMGFQLLDVGLLSFLLFIIIARILGIIYHYPEFWGLGWSLLPVSQPESEIVFFSTWPWAFFRFTDGYFLFVEAASALLLSKQFIKTIHKQNLLETGFYSRFYNTTSIIQMAVVVPFALAALANGYLQSDFDPSLPVFIVFSAVVLLLLFRVVNKDELQQSLLLVLTQFLGVMFLRLTATETAKDLSGVYLFYAILISLSIFHVWSLLRQQRKKALPTRATVAARGLSSR